MSTAEATRRSLLLRPSLLVVVEVSTACSDGEEESSLFRDFTTTRDVRLRGEKEDAGRRMLERHSGSNEEKEDAHTTSLSISDLSPSQPYHIMCASIIHSICVHTFYRVLSHWTPMLMWAYSWMMSTYSFAGL